MTGEEIVEAERPLKSRVALLALLAGILPVVGMIIQGPLSNPPKNFLANLLYYDSHQSSVILGSALRAVGLLATAIPMIFLMRAAMSRGANVPRFAPGVTLAGAVVLFFGTLAIGIVSVSVSTKYAGSGLTWQQAKNVLKGGAIVGASAAGLLGSVALAFGVVMASLHSMRVGLMTKFMGYTGILAGVLIFLPIFSPLPVVQLFWLAALAALIAGRWPSGTPAAWEDGEPHPWPSAAELRERAAESRELEQSSNGKGKKKS
jgi:hypothetical protein